MYIPFYFVNFQYREDPNILAQGCYFFAALTATLPGDIVQHTDPIVNIFKASCKYLSVHLASLRQFSIQTHSRKDLIRITKQKKTFHRFLY